MPYQEVGATLLAMAAAVWVLIQRPNKQNLEAREAAAGPALEPELPIVFQRCRLRESEDASSALRVWFPRPATDSYWRQLLVQPSSACDHSGIATSCSNVVSSTTSSPSPSARLSSLNGIATDLAPKPRKPPTSMMA